MKISLTIAMVSIATILLVASNAILSKISFVFHENTFINGMFKYQIFALLVAIILLLITIQITPESKQILDLGNVENIAIKENWLGINGVSTWQKTGYNCSFLSVFQQLFSCFWG